MAKQSGLHQLKGKVDGYSYYRQSGVKAGLMRRINEGMSARVKTSEEFANTRLNNSEFGNAADVAKVLASVITPKFRPMFLNFSQAKLTKSLLALIKQATGDWGQRGLSAGDAQAICDAVSALAKNDFATFLDTYKSVAGEQAGYTSVEWNFSADNAQNLAAIGADGVVIKNVLVCFRLGQYSSTDKRYVASSAVVVETESEETAVVDMPGGNDLADTFNVPSLPGTVSINVALAILMPYRTINGKSYTLQEKCTFKMIPAILGQ